jgi:hypothetical protein
MVKPGKRTNWKDKLWDVYSLYIRKKSGGVCEFHKKLIEKSLPAPCSCSGVLQACHKISRKYIFIDDRNVFAACSGSNAWSHYHEVEWNILWRKMWPEDIIYLEELKKIVQHWNAWTCEIKIREYKEKIEAMK